MAFVQFPLRLSGGFLRRTEEPEAVLALIDLMGKTPHGSWPGCRHFGLRDLLTDPKSRQEFGQAAVQELNRALEDLGITHYRVQCVQREPVGAHGAESYVVTLASTVEADRTVATTIVREQRTGGT